MTFNVALRRCLLDSIASKFSFVTNINVDVVTL